MTNEKDTLEALIKETSAIANNFKLFLDGIDKVEEGSSLAAKYFGNYKLHPSLNREDLYLHMQKKPVWNEETKTDFAVTVGELHKAYRSVLPRAIHITLNKKKLRSETQQWINEFNDLVAQHQNTIDGIEPNSYHIDGKKSL